MECSFGEGGPKDPERGRKYKGVKYPFKKPVEEGRPGWFELGDTPKMRTFREKNPHAYHEPSFTNVAGFWSSMVRAAMEIVLEETVTVADGEDEEREKHEKRVQQVMAITAWANRMSEGVLALRVAYLEMRRDRGISEANYLMGLFMDKVEARVHGL